MRIDIVKTNNVTHEEWDQIIVGFNDSFSGRSFTKNELIAVAESNSFGYSYHALCRNENDIIIGFNSIIPNYYIHNNNIIKVGLSGSTFVIKEYRKDIFIFYDMYTALKKECLNEGIVFFLGIPNSNSYQYSLKFLKCKEVFDLPYYIFPKNIFKIVGNGKYSFLNQISNVVTFFGLLLSYIFSIIVNFKESLVSYKLLQDESFLKNRFRNEKYITVNKGSFRFTYVTYKEKGILNIYLMYFSEDGMKTLRSLTKALIYIYINESFDIITYVGTMNLKQFLMIKIPPKYEPQRLPFTYNILNIQNSSIFDDINIKASWDFSLINFDVR
jgi:hypothetical protein